MSRENEIYPHSIAAEIVEEFESVLDAHGIYIPDGERTGDGSEACLFGNTYSDLIDNVEYHITKALKELKDHPDNKIVEGIFG